MKILAIDASGIAGSVAYIKDYEIVGEYYICYKLTHSETIMPMLENLKQIIDLPLEELDAIAVTSGPGSFTGLRIGVATAKAMALALNIPVIGVPTLDVLANSLYFTEHLICPIMDARRQQVYTSLYQWQEGSLKRLTDYEALPIETLLGTLEAKAEKVIFLGDGEKVFKEEIVNKLGERALFAPSFIKLQHAGVLAECACQAYERGEVTDADLFAPLYLRKSQAEREREEREKQEGALENE